MSETSQSHETAAVGPPPNPGGNPYKAAARPSRRDNSGLWKAAVAVLVLICVGLVAALTQRDGGTNATPVATVTVTAGAEASGDAPAELEDVESGEEPDEWLLSLAHRIEGDPMAMGPVDAPVVLIEWADYRCPFCSVWAEDTLPQLKPLVDDGSLRIEFRDLAIFGDDSVNAAAAARAAGEQGLFWEYQHALYAALPNQGHPPVGDDLVEQIAQQVGVADMDAFMAAYRADETREAVRQSSAEAQSLGISSTPTFLVGSEVISGAQPIEVFEAAIRDQISKHG